MTALDDLAALDSLTISDQEKRARRQEIKARAWQAVSDQLPITRTITATIGSVQRSVTITVTGMNIKTGLTPSGDRWWAIRLWGSDNRALIDWPLQIVNPPLLVADPLGDIVRIDEEGAEVRFSFAPLLALRGCIRVVALQAAKRR